MPSIRVAAGILLDADRQVLLAERLGDSPFHGLWEFPGGKLAPGESSTDALLRELEEEIGVRPETYADFMQLRHEYDDRVVEIDFFLIERWAGQPDGREGQRLRWRRVADIEPSEVLPADVPVLDALSQYVAQGFSKY